VSGNTGSGKVKFLFPLFYILPRGGRWYTKFGFSYDDFSYFYSKTQDQIGSCLLNFLIVVNFLNFIRLLEADDLILMEIIWYND